MSWQRHPDAEAIARYQAGLVGGFRGRRLAAHVAGCARCASVGDQLAEVSSVLASVPAAPLPDTVERQITAALATEAATRQAATAAGQAAAGPAGARLAAQSTPAPRPTPDPQPTLAPRSTRGPKPTGPRGGWSTRRFRPVMVAVPAVVCLLLAGFGYLLSQPGNSSGPSASSAAAPASTLGASAASGPHPAAGAIAPTLGLAPPLNGPKEEAAFTVIDSGTKYQKATLATQVRGELAAGGASPAPVPSTSQPAASPSGNASASFGTFSESSGHGAAASTAGSAPSRSLVDCVLHLTGGVPPSLVDRATYEGKPAYVIASRDKVWVVGPDCTASDPAVITSTTLTSG
jgi:hypothetical protein